MISALLYLQITSWKNRLLDQCRRLKQPKYLAGAAVGAVYFYWLFQRPFASAHRPRSSHWHPVALPPESQAQWIVWAAVALLVIVLAIWLIPNSRASLKFTEAEVAFLFPAPVSRRRLIHFKLLRSQAGILLSAFFFTLVSRKISAGLGGNVWIHSAGWWVLLSTVNLHLLGASFAREQLLLRGIGTGRRRALIAGALALAGLGGWGWVRLQTVPPVLTTLADLEALFHYLHTLLTQPPLSWLLAPFTWVIRPYFATTNAEFFLALGPAALVLAAHYWWVIRANVAFEEASLEQARHLGERQAALRAGDWRGVPTRPTQARPAPFPLAASGPVVTAFLWKNLLALGPFFRLRTWLIAAGVIIAFHLWGAAAHFSPAVHQITVIAPIAFGSWLLIIGPMLMRSDLRLLVSHFDLLKGYPLRGWQVILGSLLPSLVVLAAIEWLLLLLAGPSMLAAPGSRQMAAALVGSGALGIAVVLPPLSGLMLSIPYAATLFFPAWAEVRGPRGGGIEAMGQRLIFFAGYLLVMLVALLPAALCGGLAAFIAHWLGGTVAAIVATSLVACAILGAEFAAVVWWLGDRFERLDLSAELPR